MDTINASDKEFFREQFKKQDEEWEQIKELISKANGQFEKDGYFLQAWHGGQMRRTSCSCGQHSATTRTMSSASALTSMAGPRLRPTSTHSKQHAWR